MPRLDCSILRPRICEYRFRCERIRNQYAGVQCVCKHSPIRPHRHDNGDGRISKRYLRRNGIGFAGRSADREVRALYQKILNREPDSGGFAFWVGVATENPDGLGMMVDNFLTTPPAYEAMNRISLVLAIYQAILGTPGGAVSPVSYSDWSDAVNQFLSFPQLCADRFCGWQVAGSGRSDLAEFQHGH